MNKRMKFVIYGTVIIMVFVGSLCYLKQAERNAGCKSEKEILFEESIGVMTKQEALEVLFTYLYGEGKDMGTVTFFEENVIGYKWSSATGNVTSYLCEVEDSYDGEYLWCELFHELFDSNGLFIRTQWINEYAVNVKSGEVIPSRIELEDGTWELNPEYDKVDN